MTFSVSDIERLARAASPGPWWTDITNGPGGAVCRSEEVRARGHFNICGKASDSPRKEWIKNAAFIAAANPEAVLAMCEELKRLTAENDTLRAIAAKVMPCHYCGIDSIAKCPRGFPGCALADDMMAYDHTCSQEIARLKAIDQPRAT